MYCPVAQPGILFGSARNCKCDISRVCVLRR